MDEGNSREQGAEARRELVRRVLALVGPRQQKTVLQTTQLSPGAKGENSTALQQAIRSWAKGAKITDRALHAVLTRLEAAGMITRVDYAVLQALAETANRGRLAVQHADVPREAVTARQFLERIESGGALDRRALTDPQGVIRTLNDVTMRFRASKDIKRAMHWAWHFFNFFGDKEKDHLSVGLQFRLEAAAYSAWFMAWMGLQIESEVGVKTALTAIVGMDEIDSPVIASAFNTVSSYYERITHQSNDYPNVTFACQAFENVMRQGGIFPANLDDPLITYNAANELRLRGHPLGLKVDIFNGRTLEEQLKHNADEAASLGRQQEVARITGSYVRGLINDKRFDDAEAVGQKIFEAATNTKGWMLSSRANALHAEGLLRHARGDTGGSEMLSEAAGIYLRDLRANRRAADVIADEAKIRRKHG